MTVACESRNGFQLIEFYAWTVWRLKNIVVSHKFASAETAHGSVGIHVKSRLEVCLSSTSVEPCIALCDELDTATVIEVFS